MGEIARMKTNKELAQEFTEKLNALLLSIRDKAICQFNYSIEKNVPNGILEPEEVVPQAINTGLVSGISTMNEYSISKGIDFACDILEDVNACKELRAFKATLNNLEKEREKEISILEEKIKLVDKEISILKDIV